MEKSLIRKKNINNRKINFKDDLNIDFLKIISLIKKNKKSSKIVGGYYPVNYEIDDIQILARLEKKRL
ncbi:MAG: hypothetical protein ACJZ4G_04100 [Candidatus Pelagibacter sp.]